jgi:hypothetical protein
MTPIVKSQQNHDWLEFLRGRDQPYLSQISMTDTKSKKEEIQKEIATMKNENAEEVQDAQVDPSAAQAK